MATDPVFKIIPATQKYDWGKVGLSSKVAQFAAASKIPGFTLDESAPYAELWMGTHPSGPSRVLGTDEPLSKHLAANPQLMGQKVLQNFEDAKEGNIPFLFKVLAIEKALSIQTHPDKETAKVLHKEHPDIYKDANHKPEMALAITPFTAMCGFLPLPKLASYIRSVPEFAALIPTTISAAFLSLTSEDPSNPKVKTALKDMFSAVMTAEPGLFQSQLRALVERYKNGNVREEESDVKDLVLRLESQFPGDIGVFCAYMLNYVKLQPGEAIFLAAGEPHAYVSGDIMECMATSDNVIRAGLTPKLRDIPNLVSGLTYNASDPSKHYVRPAPFPRADTFGVAIDLYDPPVPEFSVLQIKVPAAGSGGAGMSSEDGVPARKERVPAIDGPSIAIVTEGGGVMEWGGKEGAQVGTGEVVFVGAGTEVTVEAQGGEGMVIYWAFVEA
ncbi:mannos-6-phosphate isomerase [Gloeophyllum trabeum ATCC 11539]|uniref:Mannose-6-phosphate isomerase n=1 Tax=Gloeophyllum trabeum (strain ATCC 11539 / FP-39264 / Madison 617) TaxID=670483 RepID=S7QK22_GLOTA|nr:mannos-6-phosphate isomerase [Gloeophyllum trabeum ATCC 11539]EPQ59727.1 mannos-6-phosphate isomerase [Gloeophyllum trabeum ATCC 11539]